MIYTLKAQIRFRSRSYDCMHDVRPVAMGTHTPWCHRRATDRVMPGLVLLYSHPIVYSDENRARYQKNEHFYTPARKITCSITAMVLSVVHCCSGTTVCCATNFSWFSRYHLVFTVLFPVQVPPRCCWGTPGCFVLIYPSWLTGC